jgi:glyoxylase-like metal-dependent hydrolase (beta-lactamase superfamily II)
MSRFSWKIGAVTITRFVENEAGAIMRFILPQATSDEIKTINWLAPHFADENGRLKGEIKGFVVETPTKRIMVDTCVGNDKDRPNIPNWDKMQTHFLKELQGAGFPRESFDVVLCTHLHVDHVGWNTLRVGEKWVPTFPNARYLIAEEEYNHWCEDDEEDQAQVMSDSVEPVFQAGLADLVSLDHRVCDEVCLTPTVGHTPGHVSVLIESGGETAIISGDFVHHPCQIARPHWASTADSDQYQSTKTRESVFADLAGTPTLLIGTHFAAPCAGRIVRDGDAFRLDLD